MSISHDTISTVHVLTYICRLSIQRLPRMKSLSIRILHSESYYFFHFLKKKTRISIVRQVYHLIFYLFYSQVIRSLLISEFTLIHWKAAQHRLKPQTGDFA